MLHKTIFILVLPLWLTLPSWAADGLSAPSSLYIGTAGVSATQQDEAKGSEAASLAEDPDTDASNAGEVDCFYRQNTSNTDCLKEPQAQAPDATPGLHQNAGN